MNRRDFVKRLFVGAAGVAASELIDVERLLWVPGEKTIFLPAVEEFHGTLITPSWVTKDVAQHFLANLKMVGRFDQYWDESGNGRHLVTARKPTLVRLAS